MSDEVVIKCENLYKEYPMYKGDSERLKALILPYYKPKMFNALKNINLEFKKGEIIGVIGLNGSGKSTLASIISKITFPSSGILSVKGEVNMLSAGVGMDSNLTGVENIEYKGILLGFTKSFISEIKQSIIDFADIGAHINQPDEALAVGDNSFTDKCLAKMEEFKQSGKTIIFVSHSVMQMQGFCDKVMWLNKGTILGIEKPDDILMPYCGFAREFNAMTNGEREQFNPTLKEYQEKYL